MNPTKQNAWTLFVLFVLLAGTVGAAYVDVGKWNTAIAMMISTVKAALIVLVFMKLHRSGHLVVLTFFAGLFWLAILISLTLGDFFSRS
ncbi:MAG TPA: cytochrome C oxidase subunit IV family protein [Chthoniobacterales bacterium]